MASGKCGSASLAAGVLTQLYPGPAAGFVDVVNINFCNTNASATTIQLAISTSTTAAGIATADWFIYGRTLPGTDEYERTGIVVTSGESIWALAAASGVSVRAHCIEQAA
jgi:hypothetical protein